eukprot:1139574-Pelagomonas_calceolata.AAC.8
MEVGRMILSWVHHAGAVIESAGKPGFDSSDEGKVGGIWSEGDREAALAIMTWECQFCPAAAGLMFNGVIE